MQLVLSGRVVGRGSTSALTVPHVWSLNRMEDAAYLVFLDLFYLFNLLASLGMWFGVEAVSVSDPFSVLPACFAPFPNF